MMVRYNKKVLDRKLGQTLKEKQEFNLRVKLFIKWLRKYRHLRECDKLLANRYKHQVYKDIFKLWRIRYLI